MASAFLVVLLAVGLTSDVVSGLEGNPTYSAACPAAYKAIDPHHTMCLTKGPGTPVAVDSNDIVAYHNQLRAGVSDAADLFSVHWDPEVAKVSEYWVAQCYQYGPHDKERSVPTLPGIYIGQNMAWGFRSFRAAIDGWWSEVKDFKHGVGSINGKTVGHYTQAVSKDVYRIGCAQADCKGVPYYGCNYVTGHHGKTPYTKGTPGSACPNNVNSKGLCDCGGLICMNNGILDVNKCTCWCQNHMEGSGCGTLKCPTEDTTNPCSYMTSSYCKYKKSGSEEFYKYICPNLCGRCNVTTVADTTTTSTTTTTTTPTTTQTTPTETTTTPTTTTTTPTTTTTTPTTTQTTPTETTTTPTTTTTTPTTTTTTPTTTQTTPTETTTTPTTTTTTPTETTTTPTTTTTTPTETTTTPTTTTTTPTETTTTPTTTQTTPTETTTTPTTTTTTPTETTTTPTTTIAAITSNTDACAKCPDTCQFGKCPTCPRTEPYWCRSIRRRYCRFTMVKRACRIRCGVCKQHTNVRCVDKTYCRFIPARWCSRNIYGRSMKTMCPRRCGQCWSKGSTWEGSEGML